MELIVNFNIFLTFLRLTQIVRNITNEGGTPTALKSEVTALKREGNAIKEPGFGVTLLKSQG